MSNFDNTNRGAMFKNQRKEEGDRKPEYTGNVNVEGVDYFLDAWIKTSAAGQKFMSVSVKRKDMQGGQSTPPPAPQGYGQPAPTGYYAAPPQPAQQQTQPAQQQQPQRAPLPQTWDDQDMPF